MNTKTCSTCKRLLSVDEFYKRAASEAETRPERRLQSACKSCMKDSKKRFRDDPLKRAREYELKRKRRLANPEKSKSDARRNNLKQVHGLSLSDFNILLEMQGGVCACCKKPESAILHGKKKRLAVDHCHETGLIRGLLCSKCNTAIGLMDNDVDLLEMAQCYLLLPIEHGISGRGRIKPNYRRRRKSDPQD